METTATAQITDMSKDSVGMYLEEIARTPLLTAEDEVELARRIEAGLYAEQIISGAIPSPFEVTDEELDQIIAEGREAERRFVQANLRLVVSVARKYGRNQMPLLDLIQEGNTGLLRAVEKFDYTKGYKFSTYSTWWIRQAITRGAAQQARIVRLPVHVAEQINQVSNTRRILEKQLGREPEIVEIAETLEMDVDKVYDLMSYSKEHTSLDAPLEDGGDTTLGDLIAKESAPGPDEEFMQAEDRRRLETMLAELDERSADVVRRRYGLTDGRQEKLADIGEVWGITAERVRQIERSALARMRQQAA